MAWSVGHPTGHSRRLGWGPVYRRARRRRDHASGCGGGAGERPAPGLPKGDVFGNLGHSPSRRLGKLGGSGSLLAPTTVNSPTRIIPKNNAKIRPEPDRGNAFAGKQEYNLFLISITLPCRKKVFMLITFRVHQRYFFFFNFSGKKLSPPDSGYISYPSP